MQNSGLGNAINPLISIAHKKVYSIPMVLIIGWRGSPGTDDEPQHKLKGNITTDLLKLLNIKYYVINSDKDFDKVDKIFKSVKKNNQAGALLIKNGVLKKIGKKNKILRSGLEKEYFFLKLLKVLKKSDRIISSTGYTSREIYQTRINHNIINGKDFYLVGGMGHTLSTALGYLNNRNNRIICIDGDGSLLMHLGSMHLVNVMNSKKLKHIILNNNSHESVGGQTTQADLINFKLLSRSLGYKNYLKIDNKNNLSNKLNIFLKKKGPSFLEVICKNSTLKNLTRPKNLEKIKKNFL